MPNITNFAFCEISEGRRLDCTNIQHKIETDSNSFTFGVIFSIAGFSSASEHAVYVTFENPRGEILIETEKYPIEKEEKVS